MLVTSSSNATIRNCVFEGNGATIDGGGIAVSSAGRTNISFCNFLNNRATGMGGGLYSGTDANSVIINCIFWNNDAGQGTQLYRQQGSITISYCIVDEGVTGNDGWNGQHIIDEDPDVGRGRVPDIGLDGYFLDDESPAIDAGSGQADELEMQAYTTQVNLSPDQDVVDIGFHYLIDDFTLLGRLSGYVYDEDSGMGLETATVTTSRGQSAVTNNRGFWEIQNAIAERPFNITASMQGWNDSTLTDQMIEENEAREIVFSLLHPMFTPSRNRIDVTLTQADSTNVDLTISNDGNGWLEWQAEKRPPGGGGAEPWQYISSVNLSEATGNARI
jgi:hypothetical protein